MESREARRESHTANMQIECSQYRNEECTCDIKIVLIVVLLANSKRNSRAGFDRTTIDKLIAANLASQVVAVSPGEGK